MKRVTPYRWFLAIAFSMLAGFCAGEETLRQAVTLAQQLKQTDPAILARIARARRRAAWRDRLLHLARSLCELSSQQR